MDALILSCGTGGGHNAAGRAIAEELERRGHHVVLMNPYSLCGGTLAEKIDNAYISTAGKTPGAFGAVYKAGELYRKLPFRSPVYYANGGMAERMAEYLEEHHFDIVIMPHLFPAEIFTNMKHQGRRIPRTMFVATDYCCIPFTEETDCDAYVIPAADLEEEFSGKGIPKDRIYAYGIPVGSCFQEVEDQRKVRARLGLAPEGKYILIAGGSMGAGKIEKLCGTLLERAHESREAEVIAVCGKNRGLYERLRGQYGDRMITVGHTDEMAGYLRACSLYLTKPGGLSSTEAAVMGVPLMHMPPIPGCETWNARYFQERHMSVSCEVSERGAEAVFELLQEKEACAEMAASQRKWISQDGAARICGLAEQLVQENYYASTLVESRCVGAV